MALQNCAWLGRLHGLSVQQGFACHCWEGSLSAPEAACGSYQPLSLSRLELLGCGRKKTGSLQETMSLAPAPAVCPQLLSLP